MVLPERIPIITVAWAIKAKRNGCRDFASSRLNCRYTKTSSEVGWVLKDSALCILNVIQTSSTQCIEIL